MTGREAEKSAGAGRRKRRVVKALEEFDRDNDEKRNSNGDVTTMARFDMLDHQLVAAGGSELVKRLREAGGGPEAAVVLEPRERRLVLPGATFSP